MARKAKKRGVKPGTKRGKYKRLKVAEIKFPATYTPAPVLTLCGQLEDSIMLLETRISNAIAKINRLM